MSIPPIRRSNIGCVKIRKKKKRKKKRKEKNRSAKQKNVSDYIYICYKFTRPFICSLRRSLVFRTICAPAYLGATKLLCICQITFQSRRSSLFTRPRNGARKRKNKHTTQEINQQKGAWVKSAKYALWLWTALRQDMIMISTFIKVWKKHNE